MAQTKRVKIEYVVKFLVAQIGAASNGRHHYTVSGMLFYKDLFFGSRIFVPGDECYQ